MKFRVLTIGLSGITFDVESVRILNAELKTTDLVQRGGIHDRPGLM